MNIPSKTIVVDSGRHSISKISSSRPRATFSLGCWVGSHLAIVLLVVSNAPAFAGNTYSDAEFGGTADSYLQDYRAPADQAGTYDAVYTNNVASSDGGVGYFYGGFVHSPATQKTLVQFVCWPAGNSFPSGAQQIPIFAGKNMVGYPAIGEGSGCAVKGDWPLFSKTLWTTMAIRFWQPADGTPNVSYKGFWMKDPTTNEWHHLATFKYPFNAVGLTSASGWQEQIGNSNNTKDIRNIFFYRNNSWNRANTLSITRSDHPVPSFAEVIESGTALRSYIGAGFAGRGALPLNLTLPNQPLLPTFDPITFDSLSATRLGSQLLVEWRMPLTSSPQLGYKIEVFDNANYLGIPLRVFNELDPQVRHKLLDIAGINTPFVRLTISDILRRDSPPSYLVPIVAVPTASVAVGATVPGLNYGYYEAASGVTWNALPDFTTLPALREGAVNVPDASPRLRRKNCAFTYEGYFNAPTTGIYSFTLNSGDGSALRINGATVIDFDGLHDSTQRKSGSIALAAGRHAITLRYFRGTPARSHIYNDGIGLSYEGPGIPFAKVSPSAFTRLPGAGEPVVSLVSPLNNSVRENSNTGVRAQVEANGATINSVQFYLVGPEPYYPRPDSHVGYLVEQDSTPPYELNSMVWTATTNQLRARVIYNGNKSIDSEPITITTTDTQFDNWTWTPLEVDNYPDGLSVKDDSVSIVGDGMNLATRSVTGDCTLIARIADLTSSAAAPDGISASETWRGGIILRSNLLPKVGEPLGNGQTTRFAALFGAVNGKVYFQDDTMREGNGDANKWSNPINGSNKWLKIQRVGDVFTSSVSEDCLFWSIENSVTLAGFGNSIQAGIFTHSLQSFHPTIHRVSFDRISILAPGIVGPASYTIFPKSVSTPSSFSVTMYCSIIGPAPVKIQWRFNGVDIPGANSSTYTIPQVEPSHVGNYTVVVDGVTTAAVPLSINYPTGSGVWSNASGGSWATATNWINNAIAGSPGAHADFVTRSLASDRTVTLDGARIFGSMVFNDLDANKNRWTLSTGTGGPITLSTDVGLPKIGTNTPTTISAVVNSSGGLIKSGTAALVLSGVNAISGSVFVSEGILEVASKPSIDVPYRIASDASLKIGYSPNGGYANTRIEILGNGVSSTTGLYLAGGTTYNSNGQITLFGAPTTIRQYGSGFARIGTFDTNSTNPGIRCTAEASGSQVDENIEMASAGFGMVLTTEPGINTAAGDLTIRGRLNGDSNSGMVKRGRGSVRLTGQAASTNRAVQIQAGSILCGNHQCLGTLANVPISNGARLALGGFNQTLATVTNPAGATLSLVGISTLTTTTANLGGTVEMAINRDTTPNSSRLIASNALAFTGTLSVRSVGGGALAAGDSFKLFDAPSYSGAFLTMDLPTLPFGLAWDMSVLASSGTISVISSGTMIRSQSTSRIALPGGTATLKVTVSGVGPFLYEWRRNGVAYWGKNSSPSLILNGVTADMSGIYQCLISSPSLIAFSEAIALQVAAITPTVTPGGLRCEIWNGITGRDITNLTSSARYPASPDVTRTLTSAEVPVNVGDNYGQRLTGWLLPPTTGQYRFYLASDDSAELWLSTTESPANKVRIVAKNLTNAYRQYIAGAQSDLITLTSGQRYYIEILHKEGTGGDHLSVAWQTPGGSVPANNSAPISGVYFESVVDVLDPEYAGLQAWWKMDEGSGLVAFDSMGGGADGILDSPLRAPGRRLGGLAFDGNDRITCGPQASLSDLTPFTVAAWVRVNAANNTEGVIIQQQSSNGFDGQYQFRVLADGRLGFYLFGNNAEQFSFSGATPINDGQWHHVAAGRDLLGNATIYLDGVVDGLVTGTTVRSLSAAIDVGIGCDIRDNSKYFFGTIDDVRVYNRDLNAAEVGVVRNRAPVFSTDLLPSMVTLEDDVFTGSLAAFGSDPDLGEILTFSKVFGPDWLNIAANGTLSGTPGNSDVGTNQFDVRVTDGNGLFDQASLALSVVNVNDAPIVQPGALASLQASKGEAIATEAYNGSFASIVSDPDGDPLTFTKQSRPSWLSVSSAGILSGVPAVGDEGSDTFLIRATDPSGASVNVNFTITVIVRRSIAVNYSSSTDSATQILAENNTNAINTEMNFNGPIVWNNQAINDAGNGPLANGRGTGIYSGVTVNSFSAVPYQQGSSSLSGSDASQRVFRYFLDDGSAGYFTGDPVGASIHLTGLSQFINANRAVSYSLTLLFNADTSGSLAFLPATVRDGVPAAPSITAITSLPALGTVTPILLLGDGKAPLPAIGSNIGGRRGWGRLTGLTADNITISVPVRNGSSRGSVCGFILTPVEIPPVLLVPGPLANLPSATSGYDLWTMNHFGSLIRSETADPNFDGVPNLLSYAMGIDPLDPPAPGATSAQLGRIELRHGFGSFSFDYQRDTTATGVHFGIEASSDLSDPAGWNPAVLVEQVLSENGGIQTIRATYTILPGHTRLFLRFRASH